MNSSRIFLISQTKTADAATGFVYFPLQTRGSSSPTISRPVLRLTTWCCIKNYFQNDGPTVRPKKQASQEPSNTLTFKFDVLRKSLSYLSWLTRGSFKPHMLSTLKRTTRTCWTRTRASVWTTLSSATSFIFASSTIATKSIRFFTKGHSTVSYHHYPTPQSRK